MSLERSRDIHDFGPAASTAASLAEAVLEHGMPARTFLNVTVVSERHDPRGRPYYWIEEGEDAERLKEISQAARR